MGPSRLQYVLGSEGPKLWSEEPEQDQIAISPVHETILAGTSLDVEAQSMEHPF